MLRLLALSTLVLNPPAYVALKACAIVRHRAWRRMVEGEDTDLRGTWHERAIDWVYPL